MEKRVNCLTVGEMLREAIRRTGMTGKKVAQNLNYSEDAIYAAIKGTRATPTQARQKLSRINLLSGLSMAQEATGYKIFCFPNVDRHIQSMLQRVFREDREAEEALKVLPELLLDKHTAGDLTDEERAIVERAAAELSDRVLHDLNLLVELENQYHIGVLDNLLDKRKSRPLESGLKKNY